MKELKEVIDRHLDKFNNKDLSCYNCDQKKNTKCFMAIKENNNEETESEVILKFCCLCTKCYNNQKTIVNTINKLFDESMEILEKKPNQLNLEFGGKI